MNIAVMVVNAGSSSLKLDLLDPDDRVLAGEHVDAAPDSDQARQALSRFLDDVGDVDAVGHRIVHGGPDLIAPVLYDQQIRAQLDGAADLAPLHVPPALAALDAVRDRLPDLPHVICLDTAFHANLPEPARSYAVPVEWRRRYGLRRYGFHGLSYTWAVGRTARLLDRPVEDLQMVLAHLGGGASVCAVQGGRSVWTSMGFTPLEGLPMVTRSGSVDPGMLLWLQTRHGLSAEELSDGLERHSGLTGLSEGLSGDTRQLVAAARDGHRAAALALDVYTLRLRQEVAAAASSLDRFDALVFTGEIGVDQPEIRTAVCAGLPVLGLPSTLDQRQEQDRVLARGQGRVAVALVHPREDRQIAAETRAVLTEAGRERRRAAM